MHEKPNDASIDFALSVASSGGSFCVSGVVAMEESAKQTIEHD